MGTPRKEGSLGGNGPTDEGLPKPNGPQAPGSHASVPLADSVVLESETADGKGKTASSALERSSVGSSSMRQNLLKNRRVEAESDPIDLVRLGRLLAVSIPASVLFGAFGWWWFVYKGAL